MPIAKAAGSREIKPSPGPETKPPSAIQSAPALLEGSLNIERIVEKWFRDLRTRQPSLTVQNPMDFVAGELPRLVAMLRNR